jgi:peptide/nickel transport system substrate-binding protein
MKKQINTFSFKPDNTRMIRKVALLMTLTLCIGIMCSCSANTGNTSASGSGSKYGGSVVLGITQEPKIFDPHTAVAAGDKEILFNVFEGLVKCTSTGDFVPALATEYSISADAMTYTFTIRQGVLFHNGKTMTSDDVVYSLSRAAGLDTGTPLVAALSGIASVVKSGTDKVIVTLKSPDAELIPFFTTAIIPDDVADIGKTPIGTGPFVFDSYTVGQSVILTKNNKYWQSGLPYLDKVTFKITADMDAAFIELKSGTIDIFPYLTNDKAQQITANYNIVTGGTNMVQIFALNNAVKPFDNPLVREAINYAVDKDTLIQQVTDGYGTKLVTGMSPAMGSYYDKSLDNSYTYDVDKAKALLTQAGYPDGFTSTVTVPSNYVIHVNTAVVLAEQLKKVGITLNIKSVDWATWLSDVYTGRNFDSTVIALTSEYSPRDVLSRYVSTSDSNFINFNDPAFDETYAKIMSASNDSQRVELYHQLLAILVKDSSSVYLQDPSNIVAVKKDLTGYMVYPIYVQDLSTVHYN